MRKIIGVPAYGGENRTERKRPTDSFVVSSNYSTCKRNRKDPLGVGNLGGIYLTYYIKNVNIKA